MNDEMEQIYEEHFDTVYFYIRYFLGDSSNVDDLTQVTFLRAFKYLHPFKQQSSLKTWLFSIAKNVAIEHFKKDRRKQILEKVLSNPNLNSDSPESLFESKSKKEAVLESISRLKVS